MSGKDRVGEATLELGDFIDHFDKKSGSRSGITKGSWQSGDSSFTLDDLVAGVSKCGDDRSFSMSDSDGWLSKITVTQVWEFSLSFPGIVRWTVYPSSIEDLGYWRSGRV
jgi:hypothetical protein